MRYESPKLPDSGTGESLNDAMMSLILCFIFYGDSIDQFTFENRVMWLDTSCAILFTHLHCDCQNAYYTLNQESTDIFPLQKLETLADELLFKGFTLAFDLWNMTIFSVEHACEENCCLVDNIGYFTLENNVPNDLRFFHGVWGCQNHERWVIDFLLNSTSSSLFTTCFEFIIVCCDTALDFLRVCNKPFGFIY